MRVNVYIRVENEDAWLAIDNKSDWVNDKLSGDESVGVTPVPVKAREEVGSSPTPRTPITAETINKVFKPSAPDPELGYPCCRLQKPCKHWTYRGEISAWVNTLTGKQKEVTS